MKYLILNMDGVISNYWHPTGKYTDVSYSAGDFMNKVPVRTVIDAIGKVFPRDKFIPIIISIAPDEESIVEKNKWLDKHFSIKNRLFLQYPDVDRVEALRRILVKNEVDPANVYVLDYDIYQLRKMEVIGVNCIHISHLITCYEDNYTFV